MVHSGEQIRIQQVNLPEDNLVIYRKDFGISLYFIELQEVRSPTDESLIRVLDLSAQVGYVDNPWLR
jgi:uncharacterized HAD superfamily protein